MPNKKPNPKDLLIALIAFALFITITTGISVYSDYELEKNHNYTIGFTTKTVIIRGRPHMEYRYMINGKIYLQKVPSHDVSLGKDYLIKFSVKYPSKAKLLRNKKLKANVDPPSNGWKTIPDLDFDE